MSPQAACPTPSKIRYRDRLDAMLALSRIELGDKPGHTEKTPYRCRCGTWHLTSKAKAGRK